MDAENPHAGEGPVLLDIGGDVGALVVTMPEHARGLEVEIRPAGSTAAGRGHAHDHPHDHGHELDHPHRHSPYPHVGVVERRTPDGTHFSLVYPDVREGAYELVPVHGDAVVLTTTVVGGRINEVTW